jgi:hypothetical protein
VRASSDVVIFCLLLITRSAVREAVPDQITIFCRSVASLSTAETQASGIVFAHRSSNLPLRLTGVSFFRFENTWKTASSFLAGGNAAEWISNYQCLRKTMKGTDICESESSAGG